MTGNKDNSVKKITKNLKSVVINDIDPEEQFTPFPDTEIEIKNGFYIHLDADSHSSLLKYSINRYMVNNDAFDPRVATNHPSDLIQDTQLSDNLTNRRYVSRVGKNRYEFWKVKADFSLQGLRDKILSITTCNTFVRATVIVDNDHSIYKFYTNNQQ
ncbi:hypothetical protein RB653_008717 [Dictyostelium firmibasis]|uniref:Uncharacterized protein n=1 Tax=Dictyostelium firmibasis TaxID=79012 RepID=A0AAN7TT04_9MYCE